MFRALPNGVENSKCFTVILLFTVEYSNSKILAIDKYFNIFTPLAKNSLTVVKT
jgi:hypothetical protein